MKTNDKKTNGLRGLLISGLTRQQQINFILRKDNSYRADSFTSQTDKQIRNIALSVDQQVQADRQKKKKR
jgi:4-hydroxyphenylpyruvate dioxygenase-like putative hemolysin